MHSKSNPPKVFISYKWQDEEHNAWVERIYTDLRTTYGVDAQLDTYEVDFGESFSDYMTGRIDRECEAMLFVITPAAVQAVDKSQSGGVHFEMQLANARRLREHDFRIIGIYREGNENTAYLRDHRYADFRDDSLYEQNLKELADSLWKRRRKPELGGQDSEVSLDTGIWENLMSNDPTRIEAAIGRIEDRQRKAYVNRLLGIISDQRTNDLNTRIAAGNGLGMLGDPRLDALEMEMIRIPEGTFTMGTEGEGTKSPQREVYLDAFEIAKYPLTNVQYKAFLDANPDHREPEGWNNRIFPPGKANHPVVNISWNDAQAYAAWLTKETGKHYRLPTEAEWEKAARGMDGRAYPWGNEFDRNKCNTDEGGPRDTTPVGLYPEGASFYKLMDMAGNVWEWCADWYDPDYYEKGENRNPKGPKKGSQSVVRGGPWYLTQDYARCALRDGVQPDYWSDVVGVRFSRVP